jgi:hypothetical protein
MTRTSALMVREVPHFIESHRTPLVRAAVHLPLGGPSGLVRLQQK